MPQPPDAPSNCLYPTPDQQRVLAARLSGQHPDWNYNRCMHRALVEWQLRPIAAEKKAA